MSDVDLAVLTQLAEDVSRSDLGIVLQTFEADMRRLGAALTAAVTAGDTTAYRRSAHAIAGAAGAVGAIALERAARQAMTATTASASVAAALTGLADNAITALHRFVGRGARAA